MSAGNPIESSTDAGLDAVDAWLRETRAYAARVGEAYRAKLGVLWWVNLALVVSPAVLLAAAAIVAAIPATDQSKFHVFAAAIPPASAFAGLAGILIAIHKSLKCDEYQAECRRLERVHESIALTANAALARPPRERLERQREIAQKLERITEEADIPAPVQLFEEVRA